MINPRELEILSILAKSEEPMTSSQIVNVGDMLSQSTVQTVLRKLLKAKLVDVTGFTYSGNVLSRTYQVAEKAKEIVLQEFVEFCNTIQSIVPKEDLMDFLFPCKVGDAVYADSGCFGVLEYEVDEIIINEKITFLCSAYSESVGDCPSECLDEIEPDISDFGKTVFLTKEEAEQALAGIKGGAV